MENFNKLTVSEAERLALLSEECGEVIQVIGKILRHGFESRHPNGGPTNRETLERECGDLRHSMLLMIASGDLREEKIAESAVNKALNVVKYLHHQGT